MRYPDPGAAASVRVSVMGIAAVTAIPLGITTIVLSIQGAFAPSLVVGDMALFDSPMPELTGAVTATYGRATVTLADAPAHIRWLLFLSRALPALVMIALGAVVGCLSVAVMRGRPFLRGLSTGLIVFGALTMAGGVLSDALGAFARAEVTQLLIDADTANDGRFVTFLVESDLSHLWWGFLMMLVGVAFSVGQKMQKDTEGLV